MILRQILACPVDGYWDGGEKRVFDWSIDGEPLTDSKGQFVRIGCFAANCWFHVSLGKTPRQTLANAKRRLQRLTRVPSTFEYIEEN